MDAQYICPVLTAFCHDGSVDMEAMKVIYDRLIASGLDGIAVMGSSGEFYGMALEQAKQYARESLAYIDGRIPVYIGTGRLIAEETILLSNYALQYGASAVMVVGPYYIGTGQAGVEAYYDAVAGQVNGNIILYNFPDRTGHDISGETVLSLRKKHSNIIGIKDTVGAPSHTRQLIQCIKPVYPDFKIYSGYDDNFAHVVISGGDGCIAALSNLIPEACSGWVQAFRDHDLGQITNIQRTINKFMGFYSLSNPFMPAMKYALSVLGLPVNGDCMLPAVPASEGQKKQVDALLKDCGLI